MKSNPSTLTAAGLSALLFIAPANLPAQSRAEFEELRQKLDALEERVAEYEGRTAASAANKLKLSESVTELKLGGDLRLRYQYDQLDGQSPRADTTSPNGGNRNVTQRSRFRYRLRLGADFKLVGGLFGGVRLGTGENSDSAEQTFEDGFSNDDIFISRALGTYHFNKNVSVSFAPGVQLFTAADLSGFSNAAGFYDAAGVSGESRKLTILTAPGDVSFKLGKIPAKFYWDFAYNTQGQGRVDDIYRVVTVRPDGEVRSQHESVDDFAFLAGVQLGKNKKAGDWSVDLNYRQTGLAAVDPNINDSTFALSLLNTRGVELGVAYSITDFLTASVVYSHAWNLRDNLIGGQATGDRRVADGNSIDVLQVDLNLKF